MYIYFVCIYAYMPSSDDKPVMVRVPREVYDRLVSRKKKFESWGSYLNRVIPEENND